MIKPNMTTSKGYTVSGCCQSYNPRSNSFNEISGRVRVVKGDPSQDEIVKWDSNMQPINHDYGSLQRATGAKSETVNGFNIFSGLVKQQSIKQS